MSRFVFLLLALCRLAGSTAATAPACPSLLFSPLTDTIPPTILCPPNDTVQLDPAQCTAQYSFSVTAYDNLPGDPAILQTSGLSAGEPYPIGLTYNTFRATDAAGNSSTCSFTVSVRNYAALLVCEALTTVALNQNCTAQPGADYYLFGDDNNYGCPDNYTVEVDRVAPFGNGPWLPAVYNSADINKTYMARVVDGISGNKCWGNVKIIDNLPPSLVCSTIDLPCSVTDATPLYIVNSLGIAAGQPAASDNCGGQVVLGFIDNDFTLGCDTLYQKVTYRRWSATDERNNSATCIQQIRFVRQTLDDVQMPPDLTLDCQSTQLTPEQTGAPALLAPNGPVPLASAACSMSASYEDSLITLACRGHRQILRKWSVTDGCSDAALEHVQIIDLRDTTGPVLSCAAVLTVSLTDSGCTGAVDLPDVFLTDNCSGPAGIFATWTTLNGQPDTLVGTLGDFSGNDSANPDTLGVLGAVTDFPVGTHTVRYTAADECGNTAACTFILNVWDNTPPVAVCAPLQTVWLGTYGTAALPAAILDGGSTADSCNTLAFRAKDFSPSACAAGDNFAEQLSFCCAQAGDTLTATLRVYDITVPAGPVSAAYAEGHFSDCSVQIAIVDTLAPSCIAPPDTVLTCLDFDQNLAAYGTPITNCHVDAVAVELDYSLFDSICAKGALKRSFHTFSNGTPGGVCVQTIQVNYLQDYFVRFPDDVIITACTANNLYGEPQFFGLNCEKMELTYEDEVYTVVPDACFKVERTWTVKNNCTYDPAQPLTYVPNPNPNPVSNNPVNFAGPVVSAPDATGNWAPTVSLLYPNAPEPTNFSSYWSASANGYVYKQIIKVIDTTLPTVLDCPAGPQVQFDSSANDPLLWNEPYWSFPYSNVHDLCEAGAALSITAQDDCSHSAVNIQYELFLDLDGDGIQETVVQSEHTPLTNNVQYGNAANPGYSGGTPRAFDERPLPLEQQYRFAIDLLRNDSTTTASVRWDTQATPTDCGNSTFDGETPQLPTGTHRIKWIVTDACGNTSSCMYAFTLIGLTDDCQPPSTTIGGEIETENGTGLHGVTVALQLDDTAANQADTSDYSGNYEFAEKVGLGSSFEVVPAKHDNPSNGLSTFDLVLLSKHILGIEPLGSPYKIIAADVNHSNSVTSFDIVELRKLILGIYTEFPANTSWRFVPQEFGFPDPENPFATPFPESIAVDSLQVNGLLAYDFIGIKTGDLNNSAFAGAVAQAEDRDAAMVWFDLDDQRISAGQTFALRFQPDQLPAGFQFTLEHPGLTLVGLSPESEVVDDSNFGVFEQAFTASWNSDKMPVFKAVFRAERDGQLSSMLRLSDRITRSEAYLAQNNSVVQARVGLRFKGGGSSMPVLLQNTPNPFTDKTLLQFYLPQKTTATLAVYDLQGRQVWQRTGDFSSGDHAVSLDRAELGGSGIFYLELKTPEYQLMRKMVLLDR